MDETLQALRSTYEAKSLAESERSDRIRHNQDTEDLDRCIERYEKRIAQLNELLKQEESE